MATTNTDLTTLPYRERVKLIQERMRGLQYPTFQGLKKPARVLAAEKTLDEWKRKNDEHLDKQRAAHRTKLNAVKDAFIVGDVQKAVQLIHALEKELQ